jgi:hemolysin III
MLNETSLDAEPVRYDSAELAVDRLIHLAGIAAGIAGTAALLGIAAGTSTFWASLIYSLCLVAMLAGSAAYHLAIRSPRRGLLRRLDHAAIFLLIAGTYTPFTTCRLSGLWAFGMTGTVWLCAAAGAIVKLACPDRVERVSVALYLVLGWIILVGLRPMLASVDLPTALLILAGGVLYSIGAAVHVWGSLRFHTAIWHALVLVAAACHYAAILHGMVLAGS